MTRYIEIKFTGGASAASRALGQVARELPFRCAECGCSHFRLTEESRDGTPGDRTRVCADCGHREDQPC